MKKHAILMLCYYNHDSIERTLKSFKKYRECNDVDIYFLENPSKNSTHIKDLAVRYSIDKHFICSDNIGGILIDHVLRSYPDLMKQYQYISTTESDVVVEDGSIEEALNILDENREIPVSFIQINCELEKYKHLPVKSWVPTPTRYKTFLAGFTGAQFITYRTGVLYNFLDTLSKKMIIGSCALGCSNFYGASDTNLHIYITRFLKTVGGVTNLKLDHIGWEQYMDKNGYLDETNEYCLEKKKHVYRIRSNGILDNIEQYAIKDINI